MKYPLSRSQFLAAGAGLGALALPRRARAERFADRYQFACEMTSEFAFLVDSPTNALQPNPSIAAQVRAGTLKQRERIEFPYGGDILRSLAYYEDPSKPLSAANDVPENDPRILIEIFTDVTSILVKKDPFPHLTVVGLVIGNPTGTFFGDLTSRLMIFSAAFDSLDGSGLRLAVSSTASSHVLGARAASGVLKVNEGAFV